ncbi:hypothetical protein [Candidatus Nitrosocosmicus arcticus]|uniref:hypothetical protein n=1 Tax=Candidatus Nitrosocosmicus arcticus TaxID=2035267 RepID=UPI0011A59EA3|nr:hypothetical protein [Candidatus Nitrosocosmicus arcticus]
MYLRSETTQLFSIVILAITLTFVLSMTFAYSGIGSGNIESVFAQLPNDNIIQIISTSTFIDDLGNFHVIGEVNNTSFDPQTDIVITTILSDTTNNVIVSNHSAFSSISTLRQTELSPFDIIIQDPQILGKFNFMEFSTTSQPAIEKPANLVLNGSSAFFDNVGNPHVTGNIINQGQFPEQFLNLVATFYDNSSLGIVGTQSFGLNVANLTQNQMAPFDITILDNKTKSQGKFYSLNLDSVQNSMGFPFNPKFSFEPVGGFVDNGLFLDSPINNDPGFTSDFSNNNNNNNNVPSSSSSGSGNSDLGSSSPNENLDINIGIGEDPIIPGFDQTVEVTITDSDTDEGIAGAGVDGMVRYASNSFDNDGSFDNRTTDANGKVEHTWTIGKASNKGTFEVIIEAEANGYNSETETKNFEVIFNDNTNETSGEENATSLEEINGNNNTSTTDQDNNGDSINPSEEEVTGENGNSFSTSDNCNDEPGSSGGDLSECEEPERAEQNEQDEDSPTDSTDSPSDDNSEDSNNNS